MRATLKELAATNEEARAKLELQGAKIGTTTEQVQAKALEIEQLKIEITKRDNQIEALDSDLKQLTWNVQSKDGEVAKLQENLRKLQAEYDDHVATIISQIDKKSFGLSVGGDPEWLVRNRFNVGLSFLSSQDNSARITLAGEQMTIALEKPQPINVSGRSCDLTMIDIASESKAEFRLDCPAD